MTLIAASGVAAGQSGVVNARVETRSAAGGLARQIDAAVARGTAAWIGYRVPVVRRARVTLSNTGTYGRCRLEPATDLLVLARAEGGRIVELRSAGIDCDLDAGGMPLVWLTDVAADESVAWLKTLIGGSDRMANVALSAIALHDAPSAASTLVAMARQDARAQTRGKALFWVAQRASDDAIRTIAGAIDDDPDVEVKKKAVFALSQLPRDQGVPALIDVARNNRTLAVRRQAMFWLGQSNDPRAIDFFASILVK
jgi:hypothetical protein